MTKQQRKNRLIFLERWKIIPEENIVKNLAEWQTNVPVTATSTCNTIACAGGWCALMPEFKAMGVRPTTTGMPVLGQYMGDSLADFLFGDAHLFARRQLPEEEIGTAHEVVTRRFMRVVIPRNMNQAEAEYFCEFAAPSSHEAIAIGQSE